MPREGQGDDEGVGVCRKDFHLCSAFYFLLSALSKKLWPFNHFNGLLKDFARWSNRLFVYFYLNCIMLYFSVHKYLLQQN